MKVISISRTKKPELGFKLEILDQESNQLPISRFKNDESVLVDCDKDSFISIEDSMENTDQRNPFELGVFEQNFFLSQTKIEAEDFLFPVIALDSSHRELMVAWAKKSSIKIAIEKNLGTYFSRSRNKEWTKGEDSGHFQKLKKIEYVANPFYIVYHVDQVGAACHTGHYTCFFRQIDEFGNLNLLSVPQIEVSKHE